MSYNFRLKDQLPNIRLIEYFRDGIGETAKHQIICTRYQRPLKDQILTYEAVVAFCFTVKGITFFSISKNMILVQQKLDEKYQLGNTVPGMHVT